eukprot:5581415-Prymnesium_polylepis.1
MCRRRAGCGGWRRRRTRTGWRSDWHPRARCRMCMCMCPRDSTSCVCVWALGRAQLRRAAAAPRVEARRGARVGRARRDALRRGRVPADEKGASGGGACVAGRGALRLVGRSPTRDERFASRGLLAARAPRVEAAPRDGRVGAVRSATTAWLGVGPC